MKTFDKIKNKEIPLPKRKKKNTGDFVRRRRYKLSMVNLSSLSTVFEFRARRMGMAGACVGAFLLLGAVWMLLFTYTPLSHLMPTRMPSDLRNLYEDLSARLDSVNTASTLNDQYARNLMAIFSDSISLETLSTADTISSSQPLPLDSLLDASEAERRFVKKYEDEDRYNLSVLSPIAAEGMTFYSPVSGVETQQKFSESGIPSMAISAGLRTPISSIYRGTVINTFFTMGKGITVIIQHPNEFLSSYSGLSETFVAKGEKVKAGTRIGMAQGDKYTVTFELWHKGTPLPPEEYITF